MPATRPITAIAYLLGGFLFLLAGSNSALAQRSYWQVYGANEGLSQQTVQAFHQDAKGYIWVGTRAGLNRFDGERFVSFGVRHGLGNDWINAITEDDNGGIWVATNNGVSRWTPADGFTNYGVEDGLPQKTVASIAPDGQGGVWAGTNSGLVRWDGTSWRRYDSRHGLPTAGIGPLARGADGSLYVGTTQGLFERASSGFRPLGESVILGQTVSSVDVDRDGTAWAAAGGSLIGFSQGEVVDTIVAPTGLAFLGVKTGPDGTLWVRTNRGTALIEDGGVREITTRNGLPMLTVMSVFQDGEGILWTGGIGGVAKLVGRPFVNYTKSDGLGSDTVWQMIRHEGHLWVGTTGGLSRLGPEGWQTYTVANGLPSNFVRGVLVDGSGTMWVATQLGLARRVGERFQAVPEAAAAGEVFWMEEDDEGYLWLASRNQGLLRGRQGSFVRVSVPGQQFSQARILVARDGVVWVSGDNGLSRWDGNGWHTYTRRDGLSTNEPYFLAEDLEGSIWFGYHSSHGVTRFDGSRFTTFSMADGLSNDAVYSVGTDLAGNVWIGTASGLDRYDGNRFVSLGIEDGFVGSESNAGAFLADSDGTLWFGAIGGLSHYTARHDLSNGGTPTLDISSMRFGQADQAAQGRLSPFGERNLTARIATLSNVNRRQIELRYRLQNHRPTILPTFLGAGKTEAPWRELSGQQIAINNLAAGDYVLEVQGRKYRGPWSESVTAEFLIPAPFWQRWWFVFLAAVIVVCGARFFFAWQLRRVQLKNEVLQASVRRLEEADRIKNEFLSNMSHEIRTPIAGILGFADILKSEVEAQHHEFLDLIVLSARRLQRTLDSVLDLAQLSNDRLKIELSPIDVGHEIEAAATAMRPAAEEKGLLLTSGDASNSALASGHSGHLGRILDILIYNAIKFTEKGRVHLAVSADAQFVCVSVSDTGIGIEDAFLPFLFEPFKQGSTGVARTHEGNGLGLAITKRMVGLMGGDISVESQLGVGSTFTVRLPRHGVSRGDRAPISRHDSPRSQSRRSRLRTFVRR